MTAITYRGYLIHQQWVSRGKPQPDEFSFHHEDYDGPPNPRCGYGISLEDCKQQIDELELDHADTDT